MPNKNFNDLTIATTTDGTELVPVVSSGVTSAISVSNINSGIIADTMSDVTNAEDLSIGQSSIAAGVASLVSSITQQDLRGVNTVGLHRNSAAAVTSMFIYDTSKDSDGGAWTEKCQHTSWYNEPLSGKWLGALPDELSARLYGAATVGSELVTNGTFNTDTSGWTANGNTLTVVNGQMQTVGTAWTYQAISVTSGKTYVLRFDFISVAVNPNFRVGNTIGSTDYFSGVASVTNKAITFTASSNTVYISVGGGSSGSTSLVDNVSVKEILSINTTSNDYYQSTADGKFYRLWKNLISYSEELGDTSWNGYGVTISSNSGLAPNGTWTADRVLSRTDNTFQSKTLLKSNSVSVTAGTTYAFSIYAKSDGVRYFSLLCDFASALFGGAATYFDLQTQNVTQGTGSIVPIGDGWYRCIAIQTATTTGIARPAITLQQSGTGSAYGQNNWSGDGISGMYFYGAQIEQGSVATTYEPKGIEGSVSEVFRGNKKSFPKLSAIIAESSNVTIYDLTESGRPMWMRFLQTASQSRSFFPSNASATSIAAANGVLCIGISGGNQAGLSGVEFIKDTLFRYDNITDRGGYGSVPISNRTTANLLGYTLMVIANRAVNAVAMTVLPDAPVDPVTGLQVPTIAVATSAAMNVITNKGAVLSSSFIYGYTSCIIDSNYSLSGRNGYLDWDHFGNIGKLSATFPTVSSVARFGKTITESNGATKLTVAGKVAISEVGMYGPSIAIAKLDQRAINISPYAVTTSWSNSGFMTAYTRRNYLCDAGITSIADGTQKVPSDYLNSYPTNWSGGTNVSIANDVLTSTSTTAYQYIYFSVSGLEVGKWYLFDCTITGASASHGITSGGLIPTNKIPGTAALFRATATTVTLNFRHGPTVGTTINLSNVSIKESVYNGSSWLDTSWVSSAFWPKTSAAVYGTLTRTPVATGSQLVAYSGFSA